MTISTNPKPTIYRKFHDITVYAIVDVRYWLADAKQETKIGAKSQVMAHWANVGLTHFVSWPHHLFVCHIHVNFMINVRHYEAK